MLRADPGSVVWSIWPVLLYFTFLGPFFDLLSVTLTTLSVMVYSAKPKNNPGFVVGSLGPLFYFISLC